MRVARLFYQLRKASEVIKGVFRPQAVLSPQIIPFVIFLPKMPFLQEFFTHFPFSSSSLRWFFISSFISFFFLLCLLHMTQLWAIILTNFRVWARNSYFVWSYLRLAPPRHHLQNQAKKSLSYFSCGYLWGHALCNHSAEQKIVLFKITFSYISQDEIHKWDILIFMEALS